MTRVGAFRGDVILRMTPADARTLLAFLPPGSEAAQKLYAMIYIVEGGAADAALGDILPELDAMASWRRGIAIYRILARARAWFQKSAAQLDDILKELENLPDPDPKDRTNPRPR